jgi:membrane protease YdiL (CAAX protease family)
MTATAGDLTRPGASRRDLWLEVGAVLMIAVVPPLVAALESLVRRGPVSGGSPSGWSFLHSIESCFYVALPLLYILWRTGESLTTFGLAKPSVGIDLSLGLGAFVLEKAVLSPLTAAVELALSPPKSASLTHAAAAAHHVPQSTASYVLMPFAMLAIGFHEELIFRGYLIPRFERLLGGRLAALLASSALFAVSHFHYGVAGMLSVLPDGVLLGVVFLLTRRIWPCVVAHALWDGFLYAAKF